MSCLRLTLRGFLISLALAATLVGDELFLKSGERLEGKIVSETPSHVRIQTRFGTADVERAKIDRIVKGRTPQEEYEARRSRIDMKDANALFELAIFCKQNRLPTEYKKLLQDILKLDPKHDGANRELGRIYYGDRWFTKDELEKFKAAEKAEMEKKGLVLYENRWMTPDEMMKAKGFVQVDGKWLSADEADRLTAAKEFEKVFGVPLTISDSAHFSVRNVRTNEENQYLLDICEEAYRHFMGIAQPDEKELKFFEQNKFHIYILEDSSQIRQFIESGYIDRYYPPKDTGDRYLETTNFSYFFPLPLIVLSEGRHLVAGGNRETALTGMAMIHVGQVFIRRLKRGGKLPGWAEGGIAHYVEGEFNQYLTVSVVDYPFYEPHVDKWIDGWETFSKWQEKLDDPRVRSALPRLRDLMETPIEELRVDALAKSWSLTCFLIETRKEKFFNFCRDAKTEFRAREVSSAQAFHQHFAPESIEDIEKAWEDWLTSPTRERKSIPRDAGSGPLK